MAIALFGDSIALPKASGEGILVDHTAPTYGWADIIGQIDDRSGASAPSWTAYQGGIYDWQFGSGTKEGQANYHVPHDYAPGTDIHVHAHWSVAAASTGSVMWQFDLTYAKGFDQEAFTGHSATAATPIIVTVAQASPTAFKHQVAEVQCSATNGLISPAAVNVSITSGAAILTAASPLFTAADQNRTVSILGAGAAGATLHTTIATYTSTTQVTLGTTASTTVTAQDAFRYRVLETSRLEVDSIIIARISRTSTHPADTIDQDPFLHTADIHYQTTGMIGTKAKAGPGFYT